jgi:hypothetical protein
MNACEHNAGDQRDQPAKNKKIGRTVAPRKKFCMF